MSALASRYRETSLWRRRARGFVVPLLALLWWSWAGRDGTEHSAVFVSVPQVLNAAHELIANGELIAAIKASLLRDLAGFSLGASVAIALGLLLGSSRIANRLVGPSLHAIKNISLFAWIPLIMVWLGLGEASKIVFIAIAVFFPVVLNTLEGVASTPNDLIEVARIFGYSRWQQVRRVVLPSALPSIFTGVYLGLIYSWMATLGAEYLLTSGSGLGGILNDAREDFRMDRILVGVAVVTAIGFALNKLALYCESRLLDRKSSAANSAALSSLQDIRG